MASGKKHHHVSTLVMGSDKNILISSVPREL